MGCATGYGVGAVYGLLRPWLLKRVPKTVVGVAIGAAATAAVVPYSALGVSNPGDWSAQSWAADIVPHLCYGLTTALVFDALHE